MKHIILYLALLLSVFFSCKNKVLPADKSKQNITNETQAPSVEYNTIHTVSVPEDKAVVIPGNFPQASTKILHEEDLNNLLQPELEEMRHEIFARHGYIFKAKKTGDFYAAQPWYRPVSDNVNNELTAIEKANLKIIKRFENYANQYGSDFGR